MKLLMVKCLFIFFLIAANLGSFSQKPSIEAGVSYRLTPINLVTNNTNDAGVNYSRDKQLSGFSLYGGLGFQVLKNLALEVKGYARYDHLYYRMSNGVGTNEETKRILSDITFGVTKFFPSKKSQFKLGLTYGLMNNGSDYSFTEVAYDNLGNPFFVTHTSDFRFSTYGLEFGYYKSKHGFSIQPMITTQSFKSEGTLIIIQLRYAYTIFAD